MAKGNNLGLWIIAGLATIVGLNIRASSQAFDRLRYSFQNLKVIKKGSTIFNTNLQLELRIENPTKQGLSFQELVADILYKGSAISEIKVTSPVQIKPGGVTTLRIPIKLDNLTAANEVLDILLGKSAAKTVQLQGNLLMAGINLPVDTSIPISA
jgi:LEA14-like dessication related protein